MFIRYTPWSLARFPEKFASCTPTEWLSYKDYVWTSFFDRSFSVIFTKTYNDHVGVPDRFEPVTFFVRLWKDGAIGYDMLYVFIYI